MDGLRLDGIRPRAQWLAVASASAALALALRAFRLPAHHLLGGMGAGLAAALLGAGVRMPPGVMYFGLSVVCVMIGRVMSPSVAADIAGNWPIFVFMVLATAALATAMGWLLARSGTFSGSTAVWGMSPGAPSVMTLLSEKYGADARLVAFLQYSRVTAVALVSSLVAFAFGGGGGAALEAGRGWFPAVDWTGFAQTMALCLLSAGVCGRAGNPVWAIVVAMFAGAALHHSGLVAIELPWWLEAFAYGSVGVGIGLRFTRRIVDRALRSLPKVLAVIFGMIAVSSAFGLFFYGMIGIDPLSAYLAASPAGMDCIAIIASTLDVNMSFIMAVHVSRLFVALALGPAIAVRVGRRLGEGAAGREETENGPR